MHIVNAKSLSVFVSFLSVFVSFLSVFVTFLDFVSFLTLICPCTVCQLSRKSSVADYAATCLWNPKMA